MSIVDRLRPNLVGTTMAPAELPLQASRERQVADLARRYRDRLLREANLDALLSLPRQTLRARIEALIAQMIREEGRLIPPNEQAALITYILDETVGYGPLQSLMEDETITEIMVNGNHEEAAGRGPMPIEVYVEQRGVLHPRPDVVFDSKQHVLHIIDRIISPLGRRIDESSPMVDARLPDGSRVHAIIPPLSLNGPVLTIRRFRRKPYSIPDLIDGAPDETHTRDTLSPQMACFLRACVLAKVNLLVSGGTGSGKTTTLNVLASFVPESERIVTIEDAAELRFFMSHPHVIRLEARPPNVEGQGEVSIRQLVRNSLRMRPDRIVVGEVRGPEALDMLQAMNTGHEGSLSTIHANDTRDAFSRLEMLVAMADKDLQPSVVRGHLTAIHVVVQQNRMADGSRKVERVAEFLGFNKKGEPVLKDIFVFHQKGFAIDDGGRPVVVGCFQSTGYTPACVEKIERRLVEVLPTGENGTLLPHFSRAIFGVDQQRWVNERYLSEIARSK